MRRGSVGDAEDAGVGARRNGMTPQFATWLRQLDHEVEALRAALLALQQRLEQQQPRGTGTRPSGPGERDEYLRAYT